MSNIYRVTSQDVTRPTRYTDTSFTEEDPDGKEVTYADFGEGLVQATTDQGVITLRPGSSVVPELNELAKSQAQLRQGIRVRQQQTEAVQQVVTDLVKAGSLTVSEAQQIAEAGEFPLHREVRGTLTVEVQVVVSEVPMSATDDRQVLADAFGTMVVAFDTFDTEHDFIAKEDGLHVFDIEVKS